MTMTKTGSQKSMFQDESFLAPEDVIPDALFLNPLVATLAASPQGDAPVCRVPFVSSDPTAGVTAEGEEIEEGDPGLSEAQIFTKKVALLHRMSNEAYESSGEAQNGTVRAADLLTNSLRRSVTAKADSLFITDETGDTAGKGLASNSHVVDAGSITGSLGPLIDAIATVSDAGASPTCILMSNTTWARLLKLSYDDGRPVISPDLQSATEPMLLGLPVVRNGAVGAGDMYVIDSTAVLAAMSDVNVAVSDQAYFTSDSTAIRVKARCGWTLPYPNRLAKLTIAA